MNFRLNAFIAICFFAILNTKSFSQETGNLEFRGKAIKEEKELAGATITLFKNSEKQKPVITGKNGKFNFTLDFGFDYKITFYYPGCLQMHLVVLASKIPKNKQSYLFTYQINVPFFDANMIGIDFSKYNHPFTKVVFDGKHDFRDDDAYLKQFAQGIFTDPAEEKINLAKKKEKEKADREKLEAEKARKEEALALAQKQQKEKAEAEKSRKAAIIKEDAKLTSTQKPKSLKEPEETMEEKKDEPMETKAIQLQQQKQVKEAQEKKNKSIRSKYENDLLKIVASNERSIKEEELKTLKIDAETNSVIEQIRREAELKAKTSYSREQEKEKIKKTSLNQQIKSQQIKGLVKATAFSDRSIKMNNQTSFPTVENFSIKASSTVCVFTEKEIFKTIKTTTITIGEKTNVYKKETYLWGSVFFYKNDIPIDETVYEKEIAKTINY